jgi:hypothetical protein
MWKLTYLELLTMDIKGLGTNRRTVHGPPDQNFYIFIKRRCNRSAMGICYHCGKELEEQTRCKQCNLTFCSEYLPP